MRIVVCGDEHLGYRQYGLIERENDFLSALWDIVISCNDKIKSVGAIIKTGDLFNTSKPVGDLVYKAKIAMEPFTTYGIDGNHDISEGNWLKLCGIRPLNKKVELILRPNFAEPIRVAGLNWTRPALFMDTFNEFVASLPANTKIDIFVLHQLLDEFVPHIQNQMSGIAIAEKLRPLGVKVVIMGDLHEAVDMEIGGIKFIYTGSTEVNSLSEKYDKSFVILDVSDDEEKKITFQRYPINTRPFVHKFIQTEKDLDELLVQHVNAPVDRQPFLLLEYDNEGKALAMRAEEILKGKALFRLIPIVKNISKSLLDQLSTEGFERTDAVGYLKKSITAFFKPETDEYQLILQLLETPEEVDRIITAYGKCKGLI